MNILVTGSSGLVGSALVPYLTAGGHRVTRLVRSRPKEGEASWDPDSGQIDAAVLEGLDAVVHLAGENVASGRWTRAKKERIRQSRVLGTGVLVEALARTARPPRAFLSASAVGYYGDRGEEVLREESPPGNGFLASVCREWEAAAQGAAANGARVVCLRFGVILSSRGGALKKMLLPFQLGVGGVLGSGKQYLSWVAIDDILGVIHHILGREDLSGPVNVVAPAPITNFEFTKTLGRVLSRPTFLPLPAFAARLAFGEVADEMLLASARAEPARLAASGHAFAFPGLEGALRHVLGK
ncbi:MAG TPA: TIGR01777 family oxidoreductase [Planctomycetota bacterium]|nr:TIGR01777 family oxidoreductase [Planctomycetota bacterium]